MESLVRWISLALDPHEREAVLGDIEESQLSAWSGLRQMLGLAARRQAMHWWAWRPWAAAIGAAGAWQFVSGLSNVVLGWPLVAALAHTAGAAALITLLAVMLHAPAKRGRARKISRPLRHV